MHHSRHASGGGRSAEPLPLPRRQERQAAPTELIGDRGTDGSNPSPSSEESGELPYCAAGSSRSRRTYLCLAQFREICKGSG